MNNPTWTSKVRREKKPPPRRLVDTEPLKTEPTSSASVGETDTAGLFKDCTNFCEDWR